MQHFVPPSCQSCPHQQTPLLGCCASTELDMLASQKSVQLYQRGQTIYQQGHKVLGLHCVHQGKIKLSKAGGDNKEHIVQLVKPGEVIGYRALLEGGRYSTSAVALEDSVVCFVPRLDFIGLLQSNKQFANTLLHMLATSLGQAEEQLLDLAYKPVRERLAGALVLVQRTYGEPAASEPFTMVLTRDDIAALVGTAKETVSRLLSEFRDSGYITTRGSRITILRLDSLVSIATKYD